jgi:secondary thiamine-phosphate synthase enzyme
MLTKDDWFLSPSECPSVERFEPVAHISAGGQIHHTEYLHIKTPKRYALINITDQAIEVLARSKVKDGLCYIGAMHITAGIYVNDAETGLLNDISKWIERLAPYGENYQHHQTGEDNGDAHLKSFLTNHQIVVPVTKAQFDFGTWQQIFYAEYDGQRDKRILIKVMGINA